MNLTRSKKKDLLYVAVAAFFFLTACVLQTVDDYISDWSVKKTIALLTQYIFFGLLAYWTASVISRISDKSICSGIIVAIALMGGDPFCQTSQISRFLRRNGDAVFMVFLLYPALPCSRGSAYYAAGYGAQRRKTACKRMVSAVSACGGADSIGFYERSPRAGVFFCKRAQIFQRNI